MPKSKHRIPEHQQPPPPLTPSLEDFFGTADGLARTVRLALDQRGTVSRGEVRKALVAYEDVIRASEQGVKQA